MLAQIVETLYKRFVSLTSTLKSPSFILSFSAVTTEKIGRLPVRFYLQE